MLWIGSLLSLIKWGRVAQRWMAGDEPVTSLQECGVQGLADRSRRPYRYANQLPFQVENYILNLEREHSVSDQRTPFQ